MNRPYFLFELDKPDATDEDYELCEGPGSYAIYGFDGQVVQKLADLTDAEVLVSSLRKQYDTAHSQGFSA